jgi:hypothetical protein
LKEEALDRTLWRTRFGRGCRPVVRQTTEWKWVHLSKRAASDPRLRPRGHWDRQVQYSHY